MLCHAMTNDDKSANFDSSWEFINEPTTYLPTIACLNKVYRLINFLFLFVCCEFETNYYSSILSLESMSESFFNIVAIAAIVVPISLYSHVSID